MNRQKKGGLLSTPGKREREIAMVRSNSPPSFPMDTISHGYSSAKLLNSNPTPRSGSLTEWGLQQPQQVVIITKYHLVIRYPAKLLRSSNGPRK